MLEFRLHHNRSFNNSKHTMIFAVCFLILPETVSRMANKTATVYFPKNLNGRFDT